MTAATALTEEGVGHLNAQRFEAASGSFLAALRHDPRAEQAWLGLALALALDGKLGDVIGLAEARQRQLGDGFLFCHAALGTLVGYRLYDHILAFERMVPDASLFAPSVAYHAGCVALLRGDEDAAFGCFGRFKRLIAERPDTLPIGPESHFNIAYRQGSLIEDRDYVAALGETNGVAVDFAAEPRFGPGEAVIAAACDSKYFALFAPGFVRSAALMTPEATLHLHVIGPDAATAGFAASLAAERPDLALNISTEPEGQWRSGAYYASNRFLIGPALLDRYGKRLVLTDIDIEFTAALGDLLDATAACDFAAFRHDGAGPASRYPAVLTCWAPNSNGRDLFDRLGRFIRSKLDIPWPFNWMLDQAALISALRWARLDRPEIAIGIINDLAGHPFQHWLRPVGGEEKAALIRAAGG
jgi:hypothetical protein